MRVSLNTCQTYPRVLSPVWCKSLGCGWTASAHWKFNFFHYSFRTRQKICGSDYISSHNIICESSCSCTSTSIISSYWPTTTQLHLKAARTSKKVHLTHQTLTWGLQRFSPSNKQFCWVIKPADQKWIVQCLYDSTGQMKQQFSQNWLYPPSPCKTFISAPSSGSYFRQCMFLWAPMRM